MILGKSLVFNTIAGPVHIVSFRKFMRLVPRKVISFQGGVYVYNVQVPVAQYVGMRVDEIPNDTEIYQRKSIPMLDLGAVRPQDTIMTVSMITEVDPRAKRRPSDILESMALQWAQNTTHDHRSLLVFRVAPRTWVLTTANMFSTVLAEKPDGVIQVAFCNHAIITTSHVPVGVRIRRMREVI